MSNGCIALKKLNGQVSYRYNVQNSNIAYDILNQVLAKAGWQEADI